MLIYLVLLLIVAAANGVFLLFREVWLGVPLLVFFAGQRFGERRAKRSYAKALDLGGRGGLGRTTEPDVIWVDRARIEVRPR